MCTAEKKSKEPTIARRWDKWLDSNNSPGLYLRLGVYFLNILESSWLIIKTDVYFYLRIYGTWSKSKFIPNFRGGHYCCNVLYICYPCYLNYPCYLCYFFLPLLLLLHLLQLILLLHHFCCYPCYLSYLCYLCYICYQCYCCYISYYCCTTRKFGSIWYGIDGYQCP